MPTAEAGEEKKVQWSHTAILLLLQLWDQHQESFVSPKTKKKTIWQKIARLLSESGHVVSWAQAESKWKNLTKRYRDVIDHNNTSGNSKKTCAYFNEISDIYGYKPNVNPIMISSSLQDPKPSTSTQPTTSTPIAKRKRGDVEMMNVDESEDEIESVTVSTNQRHTNPKTKAKKRPRTNSQEMIQAISQIHEDQKDREEEAQDKRMKLIEKNHTEKMKILTEIVTVLKALNENIGKE